MAEYLKMLSRSRSGMDNNQTIQRIRERLMTGIEGSNKLAQQVRFPTQTVAATFTEGVPSWFEAARDASLSDKGLASEFTMVRSVADLSAVYGLSLMLPSAQGESPHSSREGRDGNERKVQDMLRDEKVSPTQRQILVLRFHQY